MDANVLGLDILKETTDDPNTSKEKIRQQKNHNELDMRQALAYVRSGKSIRESARLANIPYATVRRHWMRMRDSSAMEDIKPITVVTTMPATPKIKSILKKPSSGATPNSLMGPGNSRRKEARKFTEKQEITLATLFNGKNFNECRRIAYEMAVEWNIAVEEKWVTDEMINREWMTSFRKRLPDLLEKQYRNNQNDMGREYTARKSPNASQKNKPSSSSGTSLRRSASIDSENMEEESLDSVSRVVKLEVTDYEPIEKRRKSYFEQDTMNVIPVNSLRLQSDNAVISLTDSSTDDPLSEQRAFSARNREKSRERSTTRNNDDSMSVSNQANNNHNSSRFGNDIFPENNSTPLHILNADDKSNDSDQTFYSKKSRTEDILIAKKDILKMIKTINAASKDSMDADELFLLSLLPSLKRIAEKDKLKVKIKLLEVLNQFEE